MRGVNLNNMKTLFIITYGRSGSTVLQNFFNQFENVTVRGENNNLLLHFATAWHHSVHADWGTQVREKKQTTFPTCPWFGYENVDSDALGQKLADLFIDSILLPPANTRIIGFKEIRWADNVEQLSIIVNFIRNFFPQPSFVFNTRNHDEVAKSSWWSRLQAKKVKRKLSKFENSYNSIYRRNKDISVKVHYNDLIIDTRYWIPLFEIIDRDYDEEIVKNVLNIKLNHG